MGTMEYRGSITPIPISSAASSRDGLDSKLNKISPIGSYHVDDLIERGLFTGDFINDPKIVYVDRHCLGAQVKMHFLDYAKGNGDQAGIRNVGYPDLINFLQITNEQMDHAVKQAVNTGKLPLKPGTVGLAYLRNLLPFIPDGYFNRTRRILIDEITEYTSFAITLTKIIKQKSRKNVKFNDALQDAWLGLIDAAHRYDPSLGFKFETFAVRRVNGEIIDALRKDNTYSTSIRRLSRRETHAINTSYKQHGMSPEQEEVAAEMGMTLKKYKKYRMTIQMQSLIGGVALDYAEMDRIIAYFGSVYPFKVIDINTNPLDELIAKVERQQVRHAVAELDPRARRVIVGYYSRELTMKEIGSNMDVYESRISQLHARAMRRLRGDLYSNETLSHRKGAAVENYLDGRWMTIKDIKICFGLKKLQSIGLSAFGIAQERKVSGRTEYYVDEKVKKVLAERLKQ